MRPLTAKKGIPSYNAARIAGVDISSPRVACKTDPSEVNWRLAQEDWTSRPMPIKKSELYSSLWSSCDELRGGMDASQYKDYVLVLPFIKYVSDKYSGVPYAPIPEVTCYGMRSRDACKLQFQNRRVHRDDWILA